MEIQQLMQKNKEAILTKAETLTVVQVANRLDVTTRTIIRWIKRGTFPGAYKSNPMLDTSPYVIPLEDVEAFEEKRRGSTAANLAV